MPDLRMEATKLALGLAAILNVAADDLERDQLKAHFDSLVEDELRAARENREMWPHRQDEWSVRT